MPELLLKARGKRKFVHKILLPESWAIIEPYFKDLFERDIRSVGDLQKWLCDRSELDAVLEEDMAWRYIRMNCDTENQKLSDDFNYFVTEIDPQVSRYSNMLDSKFIASPFLISLEKNKYDVLVRATKKKIEIFREENIPLIAEMQKEEQEYGRIISRMTVNYREKELTLQQASNYLKDIDRGVRENIYMLMDKRRLQDTETLHSLYSSLLAKRDTIAHTAGFQNYRDYKFADLGRFDYSAQDCFDFHEAIQSEVCPLVNAIDQHRKDRLGLDSLKPWDLEVDIDLKPPIKPFETSSELVEKTIRCFSAVKPAYAKFIKMMKENGYLDLDSRKGKAPGGFNYPLYESNVPFIFMNATGNLRDVETMVHEGGHAVHSFLSKELELVNFKSLPSEVAELASMSMELISLEHWDKIIDSEEDLKRAKLSHLEGIIKMLPWIATVDQFQHWAYTHAGHSVQERNENWKNIATKNGSSIVDWSGVEDSFKYSWQKQLHIFEVPFYYIEYGIAQMGALAIWRNYKQNPQSALYNYESALKLGYSVPIPEIYKTAGIQFNFSKQYICELMGFLKEEINAIGGL